MGDFERKKNHKNVISGNEFYSILYERYGVMPPDKYDQDWEFTAGDSEHTEDYINFYEKYSLSSFQKIEILNMIIQGLNDLIEENIDSNVLYRIWIRIKSILESEKEFYYQIIEYWSCMDIELEEDRFYVSKFMRDLL